MVNTCKSYTSSVPVNARECKHTQPGGCEWGTVDWKWRNFILSDGCSLVFNNSQNGWLD